MVSLDPLVWDMVFFFSACIVLMLTTQVLLRSATRVATYFGMSDFVIGFIIAAIASSSPEFFIGLSSAFNNNPELAIGNLIGSSVINLALVAGILAVLKRGIKIESKTVKSDTFYMLLICGLPPALYLSDGMIDRFDGFILVAAFVLYSVRVFRQRSQFRDASLETPPKGDLYRSAALLTISLIVLYGSSQYIVVYASSLSELLATPPLLMGLFLISMFTALPELVFGTRAIVTKHKYLAFGSLIGSVIINNSLILGAIALLSPGPIMPDEVIYLTSAFFLALVAMLFAMFVGLESHLRWEEGIAFIVLYVLFVVIMLNLWILSVSPSIS